MSSSEPIPIIQFDRTRRAYCFFATESTKPQDIISVLHLAPLPKGIICISGGATQFPSNTIPRMTELIESSIAPLVYEHSLLVIDGGTEAGIMQITGKVLRKFKHLNPIMQANFQMQHSDFEDLPLMGFVPEAKVKYPGALPSPKRDILLDPNHTYFVLVRGVQEWGKEVECMFTFLDYLAKDENLPAIHVIANGGRITIMEAYYSVQQGRDIIILEGSCRAPKVIVAAINGVSKTELVKLLRDNAIATQVHEVEETLFWLNKIAQYDKIACFNFWSDSHEELSAIILSKLDFHRSN